MTEPLTRLIQTRNGYRLNVKKLIDRIDDVYENRDTTPPSTADLSIISDKLNNYNTKIEKLNNDISPLVSDGDFEGESGTCLELQDAIWEAQSKLSGMLAPPAPVGMAGGHGTGSHPGSVSDYNAGSQQGHQARQVKLPKLPLDTFSGNPIDWQVYWDGFQSTIHDSDLPKIDKFKYLRKTLEGDALKMVNGYRLTESNYDTVVEALKDRYGNRDVAINAHLEQLLGLQAAQADTSSLQTTYDQCERHIRSLVALGLSEDTFGLVFAPIILSKLPRFLRVELHRQNGSQTWEINKLRELFKSELKARQMGEWTLGGKGQGPKGGTPDANNKGQGGRNDQGMGGRRPLPSTGTFMQQGWKQGNNSQNKQVSCIFCKGNHYSDECTTVTDYYARKTIAVRGKHCFKCLSIKHQIKECPKSAKCYHCGEISHHSSLCAKKGKGYSNQDRSNDTFAFSSAPVGQMGYGPSGQSPSAGTGMQGQPRVGFFPALNPNASYFAPRPVSTSSHAAAADGSLVHLQMAQVQFKNEKSRISARIFLDPGSSSCYITTSLKNRLKLNPHGCMKVSNARFGDKTRNVRSYETVVVPIPTSDGCMVNIDAYVTDTISPPLQKAPLDLNGFPILQQVRLSDSFSAEPEFVSIDILIGGDYYFDFVSSERLRLDNGLLLLGSRFGYIVVGKDGAPSADSIRQNGSTMIATTMLNFSTSGPRVQNPSIERFWSLEDVGVTDDPYQKDDDMAVQHFNKHIQKIEGRYVAGFPWKEDKPDLPDNYDMALARLRSQTKRLHNTPEFLEEYDKVLQNQARLGIIEEVTPDTPVDKSALIHYLPHHAVLKPTSVTTKVRVVHDASAKARRDALSLNECLFRGPVYLSDLCGLILRFRMHSVAFVCDIEKAFFQVGLRLADRDVTRFLWLRSPTQGVTPQNLVTYRFARVPFGVVSSPFLLGATVKHHLLHNDSDTTHDIASNMYVDNIISGVESTVDAKRYYAETQRVFSEISMNVREWFTNDKDFLESIPEKHRGADLSTRVLGMAWDTQTDRLSFDDPKLDAFNIRTKRHLIQAVSSIYDPCGFLSPVLTKPKLLVQDTWRHHLKWDDPLSEDLIAAWDCVKSEIQGIDNINIPRFLGEMGTKEWELHCFCDASAKAFAAAVYLRPLSGKSHLVFAKCRLAPLKPVSLPRLELMGVHIGAKLVRFVKSQLPLDFKRTVIWSDSKCVLSWIGSSKLLSVFVSNRVKQIKTVDCEFRHVPTSLNPADIPTRGISAQNLANSSLWWYGPQFLQLSESEWPATLSVPTADNLKEEVLSETLATQSVVEVTTGPIGITASRFSSLGRLLRVTAYALRFVRKLLKRVKRQSAEPAEECTTHLWLHEIQEAKLHWVRNVQQGLELSKGFKDFKRQLGLFKDSSGIWKCRGRLQNSNIHQGTKFPVFLPNTHSFTFLVIADCHTRIHHAGVSHTLAELRSAFWVPCGRAVVSRAIKRCQVCRLWEGGSYKPPPFPPLPDFRVNQSEPFACAGVDYVGPLLVSKCSRACKVWICLFTCAVTRAIHLEVVNDLTTDQFLLSLRRFIALYGRPKMLISDNGKYFRLANDVLKRLWHEVCQSPDIQEFLCDQEIHWKFITEYAPWMGGFYERLVGSVKRSLRKTLGRKLVSLDILQTMVAEVSAVLNTRPLVVSNDINDQILTPAKLLGRRTRAGIPSSIPGEVDSDFIPNPNLAADLVNRWKDNERVLNQFWEIWHKQYLTSLRERRDLPTGTRGTSGDSVVPGTPVLIHKAKMPRSMWDVGRIVELVTSADGIVRSAIVRLGSGRKVARPIKLLYPLEANDKDTRTRGPATEVDIDSAVAHSFRPKRKAAQKALKAVRFQLQTESDDSDD